MGVVVSPVNVRDAAEISGDRHRVARAPDSGLIVTRVRARSSSPLIVWLAAQHKLPAVYRDRFVAAGGLISYGLTFSISTGAPPAMSTASSRARSPPTCRCRRRPNTSW